MRHFDVVRSKDLLNGLGEGGMERKGYVEGGFGILSDGGTLSGGVEVLACSFVHEGSDTQGRKAIL